MKPITLVPDSISHDTVQCLEQLLEQARGGQITGLAYAATVKPKRYIVNTAGEAHQNPTLARGMVRALDDELGRMVWGER